MSTDEIRSPLMSYNPEPDFVDIKDAFPHPDNEDKFYWSMDYDELIASMNLYPLIFVMNGGYQGESLVLLRNRKRDYGILNFSWGSCSTCDAIQGCDTYDDLDALRLDLFRKTHWGNSIEELCKWWISRDTDLYESLDSELNNKFVKILRGYIDIDDEYTQKIRIKENLYEEMINVMPIEQLRKILENEDWYGSGIWELEEETVRALVI